MPKVQVWVEVAEEHFHRYECEAKRTGAELDRLVEHTVNVLMRELESEQKEDRDHPTIPS